MSCWTINIIKLHMGDKLETAGFLSSLAGNQQITDISIKTHFESDNVTPQGYTIHFIDEQKKKWQLDSMKLQTMMYPPRHSKSGLIDYNTFLLLIEF